MRNLRYALTELFEPVYWLTERDFSPWLFWPYLWSHVAVALLDPD